MIVLQYADWIGIMGWVSSIVNPSPNISNMWWLVLSVSHKEKGSLGEIDYIIPSSYHHHPFLFCVGLSSTSPHNKSWSFLLSCKTSLTGSRVLRIDLQGNQAMTLLGHASKTHILSYKHTFSPRSNTDSIVLC